MPRFDPLRDSYYNTPNVNIPLNQRDPGDLAQVAKDQLSVIQEIARGWPIEADINDLRQCHRCGHCGQNIWFGTDQEYRQFHYSDDEILALTVAHIRQVHSD